MAGDGSFDEMVMAAVVGHRTSWATGAARAVMWLGTTPTVWAVCAIAALAVVVAARAYRPALAASASLVIAAVSSAVLKTAFGRVRPPAEVAMVHVGGWSFPSTQAAETAALVMAVLVTTTWSSVAIRRAVTVALVVLLVLVGVSMVYLGAHWTTDVLAGWVLGAGVGAVTSAVVMRVGQGPYTAA
jgi:membrane-associated phospholipid phosphatase